MPKLKTIHAGLDMSPTLKANETVLKRRQRGEVVYQLGFGESPFPVAERLQQALSRAVMENKYLPVSGLPELCASVKSYYKHRAGLEAEDYDVIIAPGSKLILYILQMAVEGGLLMPVPSWVSYAPQARLLGQQIIKIPTCLDDDGYYIDPETLEWVIRQARGQGLNPSKIILNYPNNPTGLVIPEENLKQIADICVREDIVIISDEIYGFVNFAGSYSSISRYAPSHTVISTGLSKHLSLGGWRVGVSFIPKTVPGLKDLVVRMASELWSSVAAPVQRAAIAAYGEHHDIEDFIKDCTAIHALMNGFLAKRLSALGAYCPAPQGAFYVYPDFSPFRENLNKMGVQTSGQLAAMLANEYGIVSLPGEPFGAEADVLTLRLSGCDYDGAAALRACREGTALDEAFIRTYAPNIWAAAETFETLRRTFKA